jgi:hypothetical protein
MLQYVPTFLETLSAYAGSVFTIQVRASNFNFSSVFNGILETWKLVSTKTISIL